MNRSQYHFIIIFAIIFLFGSCRNSDLYNQNTKTIDSLSTVVNILQEEFLKTDTVLLKKSVACFNDYKQFIQQIIIDTISKQEADNLQRFYNSGIGLADFTNNRQLIFERSKMVQQQLKKLTADTKENVFDVDQMKLYTLTEKQECSKLIDLMYSQQKLFYTRMLEFKISIKDVDVLIMKHNNGELPLIIKDTLN